MEGTSGLLSEQRLADRYAHAVAGDPEDDATAMWVVPMKRQVAVPRTQAYWAKETFANQNSACRRRQEFTLERLAEHFGVDED